MHTANAWWSKDCKEAVYFKKKQFKKWLKNRTEEHFVNMKRAKIQCNRIIAQAEKQFSQITSTLVMFFDVKKLTTMYGMPDYVISCKT